MLQVFYVVRPEASRGPADGARGTPGAQQTGVLQVEERRGRVHPQPLISTLVCRPCGESEKEMRGQGKDQRVQRRGRSALVSKAKADGGGLRGRLMRASVRTSGC
jgi:hypothetical protein